MVKNLLDDHSSGGTWEESLLYWIKNNNPSCYLERENKGLRFQAPQARLCPYPVEFLQTFCKRTVHIPTRFPGAPRDIQIVNLSREASRPLQIPSCTIYETAALPQSYTGARYDFILFSHQVEHSANVTLPGFVSSPLLLLAGRRVSGGRRFPNLQQRLGAALEWHRPLELLRYPLTANQSVRLVTVTVKSSLAVFNWSSLASTVTW